MTYQDTLAALADPTRRSVLEALRIGPKTVGELAQEQPVSRPAVSQHLKVLSEAGLVKAEPQGNRRLYRIQHQGLRELRSYLEGFWVDVLGAFENEVALRSKDSN